MKHQLLINQLPYKFFLNHHLIIIIHNFFLSLMFQLYIQQYNLRVYYNLFYHYHLHQLIMHVILEFLLFYLFLRYVKYNYRRKPYLTLHYFYLYYLHYIISSIMLIFQSFIPYLLLLHKLLVLYHQYQHLLEFHLEDLS